MRIASEIAGLSSERLRAMLAGLPDARGFRVVARPLKYRERPHLAAWTDLDRRLIVLQLPEPFLPFGEVVEYGARRRPGKGLRFVWLTEGVTFQTPRQVARFLYLHEWMHMYLVTTSGRGRFAETTCDRFALRGYLRRRVTIVHAQEALRRAKWS